MVSRNVCFASNSFCIWNCRSFSDRTKAFLMNTAATIFNIAIKLKQMNRRKAYLKNHFTGIMASYRSPQSMPPRMALYRLSMAVSRVPKESIRASCFELSCFRRKTSTPSVMKTPKLARMNNKGVVHHNIGWKDPINERIIKRSSWTPSFILAAISGNTIMARIKRRKEACDTTMRNIDTDLPSGCACWLIICKICSTMTMRLNHR
mmetsp:Transcript_83410/g.165549  ORF Transcript_83410/g.165549 Transcript_83410/m.165549 type:complete len:206 (-) Transcript_83410:934-1551(-)